jgi:hypothetical protein
MVIAIGIDVGLRSYLSHQVACLQIHGRGHKRKDAKLEANGGNIEAGLRSTSAVRSLYSSLSARLARNGASCDVHWCSQTARSINLEYVLKHLLPSGGRQRSDIRFDDEFNDFSHETSGRQESRPASLMCLWRVYLKGWVHTLQGSQTEAKSMGRRARSASEHLATLHRSSTRRTRVGYAIPPRIRFHRFSTRAVSLDFTSRGIDLKMRTAWRSPPRRS